MLIKLVALFASVALSLPAVAQESEGAGDYAAQVAQGNPLSIPPGIYANTAERLSEFFAATKGARTIYAQDLKARIDAGTPSSCSTRARPRTTRRATFRAR